MIRISETQIVSQRSSTGHSQQRKFHFLLSTLDMVDVFSFSYSNSVGQCLIMMLKLRFPKHFHVFIRHVYIFLGEASVQIFCQLLIGLT